MGAPGPLAPTARTSTTTPTVRANKPSATRPPTTKGHRRRLLGSAFSPSVRGLLCASKTAALSSFYRGAVAPTRTPIPTRTTATRIIRARQPAHDTAHDPADSP